MDIVIRPLLKQDKPALMEMLRGTPEFKLFEVAVAEELIDASLKDPVSSGYYTLVAGDGDGIAGYICYGPTPLTEGTWDLYWVAVAAARQGQGIGSALVAAAEAEIAKAGGRLVIIETSSTPAYDKARRLHKKMGYGEIARVPDFYAPGDDRLIMRKKFR